MTRKPNDEIYHFDVTGVENIQYTVYHGTQGGHYHWHIDYGPHNPKPRKISMSIQLTDPSHYEGCDLQFQVSNKIGSAPRKARRDHRFSIVFPAPSDAHHLGHPQGTGGLGDGA